MIGVISHDAHLFQSGIVESFNGGVVLLLIAANI